MPACLLSCYCALVLLFAHVPLEATCKENTRTKQASQQAGNTKRRCIHTNCDIVLGGFELPESDIDGDTTLTLSLQLVKNPCVLEGTLAEFGSFLQSLLAPCSRDWEIGCASWCCTSRRLHAD